MNAADFLSQQNGLKTTNTVLSRQQSGLDAAQKANPQETAQQMNLNTARAMLHGKEASLTPPKDAHEQAVRINQNTAEGMLHGQIPIVKKEDSKPAAEQPRQMSYTEMFKKLNGDGGETPEQKARREKRERASMRIAAFGDGLRALSNMYFASKGARVNHQSESDMTAAMAKRKAALDAEREKNKAAWLTGYQKAMALDEESRKNDNNLAEQVRYHNQLAENRERVGAQKDRSLDQKDTQLEQNQQKIDLTKLKYTNDEDYKKQLLAIKDMLANGQISHWAAQDATARLRESRVAAKANKAANGNKTTAGYWYEYYDMMDTAEGQKKIEDVKRKLGVKNVNQTSVRWIMDKIKGRHSSTNASGGGKPADGNGGNTSNKSSNKSSNKGGGSSGGSSNGGGRTLSGIK